MTNQNENSPDTGARELLEAGRYRRLAKANERALVVLAMGLPYWIFRDGRDCVLFVEARDFGPVANELAIFENENRFRPARMLRAAGKSSYVSLFAVAWILGIFFLVQNHLADSWIAAGAASSEAVWNRGEWWRVFTALTLHGDFSHLIANLAVGLLFAAFILPALGSALTWNAILFSGALGNFLNAWGYRAQPHISIGASTAVFGALGILVACNLAEKFAAPERVRVWGLVLPLGAGAALLAFLGAGEQTDLMAHFWGAISGVVIGGGAWLLRNGNRRTRNVSGLWSALPIVILCAAWLAAGAHFFNKGGLSAP